MCNLKKNQRPIKLFDNKSFEKNLCNYCDIISPSNTPSKENSLSTGNDLLNLI